ncbi:hypothetical protein [Bergeyella zoohelcum]|uniref:Lipoprotein n=1 Tax=Bergeyella zoohelcum ATCC 43767 TaxID=883096 RepID=K1LWS8_9FLAO|nr:hypothetical protein [Bergeyella zoohelcum]EKB56582.1 hypothetical protein HMPREF9699_01311 [Bergeyella zoohelcum ATCC 43767]SUV48510.1 Uncharacterised protein [Bergeyella zoohelcum]
MKKTKPKIISLLLIASCLLLINCGSRKIDTRKNEKQQQKTETKIEYRDVVRESVRTVRDTVYLEQKIEAKQEIQQQKQRQKTSRKKEYHENGTLKSESEESITESVQINRLTLENDYLKSSAVALKEENEKLEKRESAYKSEIHSLKERNKTKKTEREAYPWYYWVIGSIIIWEALKIIVKYIIK